MNIDYLDEERKKLWTKVLELETLINEKTTGDEQEIRKLRNRARNTLKNIKQISDNISSNSRDIEPAIRNLLETLPFIQEKLTAIDTAANHLEQIQLDATTCASQINSWRDESNRLFSELQDLHSKTPDFIEHSRELADILESSKDILSKLTAAIQNASSRKEQIDEIYYELAGYSDTDKATGEEIIVNGLIAETKESLAKLKNDFNAFKSHAENEQNTIRTSLEAIENSARERYHLQIATWDASYLESKKKIDSLLPNALTAGLSHAFSEKRINETENSKGHATTFRWSIAGLIAISIIPLAVSIHSIYNNTPLEEAILRLPRLVIAILPLYIPALWIAYSANRKENLSKRLIEEYAHKEVLSKTYEGLAKQIDDMSRSCDTNLLREKLLFTILEVSSENPGKLISDYNKSDHPLMDALDKSVKLANCMEKLAHLPGFARMAKSFSEKAKQMQMAQDEKVAQGIDALANTKSPETKPE